jgi:hypothetical protein
MEDFKEISSLADQDSKSQTSELLSLSTSKIKSSIFDIMPTFSFESTTSEAQLADQDNVMEGQILKVENRLESLKSKLARPFLDIETSFTVLVSDLGNLH